MKKYIVNSLSLLCFCFTISCSKTETKENPVFAAYLPETKEYKDELVKKLHLTDKTKLAYYFHSYEEKDAKEYLHITIEGENFKADASLNVRKWDDKIQPIHDFKGKGYGGAEMINLKFEIVQDSAKTEFIYLSTDELID